MAITRSIGKLVVAGGKMGIGYLFRRRRSVRVFARRLQRIGISGDEAKILVHGYKDMISLPGLRQLVRHRKH
ncbi:MAG: hypothetical protein U9Q94_07080 [Candidatus Bipolaricaulota bacterium]|nr:hypothetical protein [Candidatus Bipolaricaulota bacterium]